MVVGTHRLLKGGTAHAIENFILHPSYNKPRLANDIALLKLSTPIQFSGLVQPIALNPHYIGGNETLTFCEYFLVIKFNSFRTYIICFISWMGHQQKPWSWPTD